MESENTSLSKSTSYIELSKSAVEINFRFIRELIGEGVKFSSVVKGNAYGHGIEEFVPIAEELGVDHFSVFSVDEAYRVKKVVQSADIMIMGMINDDEIKWAIDNDISFYVFDLDRLNATVDTAKGCDKKARIHLEFETGMNRTGFNWKDLSDAADIILENEDLFEVEGACTHYAGAESVANHYRVQKQYQRFNTMYKNLEKKGVKPKIKHTACSAATVSYPKMRMDMVRVGILQYGFWPSRETLIYHMAKKKNGEDREDPLKRVISWKTKVMVTKKVEEGEFIGYGNSFIAPGNMKIGVVPVGYAHGYSRVLSNQGRVLVRGERTAVIGTVNMNMLVIDLVDMPNVERGDEVILIGEQNGMSITVASFGELSNQLNYELLTRLPYAIPRKIVD